MEMIQLEENCKDRVFVDIIDWVKLTEKISKNPFNYIFLTTQEELTRLSELPCAKSTGRRDAPQKIYGDSSLRQRPRGVLAFNIKIFP